MSTPPRPSAFTSARHCFVDVEALGPPGLGSPFALGVAEFELVTGDILRVCQWNIDPTHVYDGERAECSAKTLRWLVQQERAVLMQLANQQVEFVAAWLEFREFVSRGHAAVDVILWADDWSDFAWLDHDARHRLSVSIRDFGPCYDSSGIVALAKDRFPDAMHVPFRGVRHVACDDAVHGARELHLAVTLLHLMPRP